MPRVTCPTIFGLIFVALLAATSWTQTAPATESSPKNDPGYAQAVDLFKQGKFVDAMPLFEKLAADYPTDYGVREGWAWCVMSYSATLSDTEQRKKARARARGIAAQAKELGDNSQILQVLLELPEDGSEPKFSDRKEVDDALKGAEADFARGDLDKARQGYLRVLVLDPNNYEAALFSGDACFKQKLYDAAGEWFAQAIRIDPNRETAYRYWGDTLAAAGRDDEARAKFIEAIIADPYNQRSWVGLTNWLQRNKLQLNNVRLKDRCVVTIKEDKSVTITLDNSLAENDPDTIVWTTYGVGRAGWHTQAREKEFPNVPRNRRTLQEEKYALNLVVTVLKERKDYQEGQKKLDPSIQSLIKIQEAGFLEPFILLNRADKDIAQDYEAYRAANRETIRRYLDDFVVPKITTAKN